jgi:hypothetical protein
MPAEAPSALDFVAATAEVRAAVAADPYFMYRSCPVDVPPPPSEDPDGTTILPTAPEDVEWDPCGSASGLRASRGSSSQLAQLAMRRRRASAQDSLLKGLRRVARVGADGTIRYTGFEANGGTREVRVHPTARVVLSDERRNGREYARTDMEWRRTPNGYVLVGERRREEVLVDGKLVSLNSTIRHRAIRIQPD